MSKPGKTMIIFLFRYDVKFGTVIGEGHFGKVWHAKAKGIKVRM